MRTIFKNKYKNMGTSTSSKDAGLNSFFTFPKRNLENILKEACLEIIMLTKPKNYFVLFGSLA